MNYNLHPDSLPIFAYDSNYFREHPQLRLVIKQGRKANPRLRVLEGIVTSTKAEEFTFLSFRDGPIVDGKPALQENKGPRTILYEDVGMCEDIKLKYN